MSEWERDWEREKKRKKERENTQPSSSPLLPFPIIFSRLETFDSRVSSCQYSAFTATCTGKYASTEINEKRTCCKDPHFHQGFGWSGRDTPSDTGWRQGILATEANGVPGASRPMQSRLQSRSKKRNHMKRVGCVWLLCAEHGERRRPAPQRITQAEQQPSSPLGCAA
jgi:hypothetical protein